MSQRPIAKKMTRDQVAAALRGCIEVEYAGFSMSISGRRVTHSAAVFFRNVRGLDEQLSELKKLRKRVLKAEMRAIGSKRRYVARLQARQHAPLGQ
jgi:hypothetical protein